MLRGVVPTILFLSLSAVSASASDPSRVAVGHAEISVTIPYSIRTHRLLAGSNFAHLGVRSNLPAGFAVEVRNLNEPKKTVRVFRHLTYFSSEKMLAGPSILILMPE